MQSKTMIQEFVEFVQKYGVIGLAIGFVTGQAATAFVGVLAKEILTPVVSWIINLFGEGTFEKLNVNIGNNLTLGFGNVISGLITFLAVMMFVFLLVKFVINKFMSDDDHKKV